MGVPPLKTTDSLKVIATGITSPSLYKPSGMEELMAVTTGEFVSVVHVIDAAPFPLFVPCRSKAKRALGVA